MILAWQGRVRIDLEFMIFYNFKALNACAARYFCLNMRTQGGGLTRRAPYSLSDLSWLTAFSSFFPQKVRFCLQNLANLFAAPRVWTYFLSQMFVCWFYSLGPMVKFAHCQLLTTVQTREIVIVGNGQISQWVQWAKKLTENSSFPKI